MRLIPSTASKFAVVLALLVLAAIGGSPVTAGAASPAGTGAPASSAAVLVVSPGKVGGLKMGTSKATARRRGWIAYEDMCGWGAGRRSYLLDVDGDEVFKAYPDKISKGKVRSMHAMGAVVSTRGIWTRGIGKQDDRLGSTLDEMVAAYSDLRLLGQWQDYVTDEWWPVYTTGSKKRGWLDFYLDPSTTTVIFVQVRAGRGVTWGQPLFGC